MDLVRVRRDKLDFDARLVSWLGARPLRCDYCRYNFVSWRLLVLQDKKKAEPHAEEIDAAGARR